MDFFYAAFMVLFVILELESSILIDFYYTEDIIRKYIFCFDYMC